jgi:hypothetical protein
MPRGRPVHLYSLGSARASRVNWRELKSVQDAGSSLALARNCLHSSVVCGGINSVVCSPRPCSGTRGMILESVCESFAQAWRRNHSAVMCGGKVWLSVLICTGLEVPYSALACVQCS